MYEVKKLDVTARHPAVVYAESFDHDTWAELMADLANRSECGGNSCFFGRGAHIFRNGEFLGPLDALEIIDKPYRQITLAEFQQLMAERRQDESEEE